MRAESRNMSAAKRLCSEWRLACCLPLSVWQVFVKTFYIFTFQCTTLFPLMTFDCCADLLHRRITSRIHRASRSEAGRSRECSCFHRLDLSMFQFCPRSSPLLSPLLSALLCGEYPLSLFLMAADGSVCTERCIRSIKIKTTLQTVCRSTARQSLKYEPQTLKTDK